MYKLRKVQYQLGPAVYCRPNVLRANVQLVAVKQRPHRGRAATPSCPEKQREYMSDVHAVRQLRYLDVGNQLGVLRQTLLCRTTWVQLLSLIHI